MLVIIDYGVGNLFSLASSFKKIGVETVVSGDADAIRKADRIVLPGVGAFEDAAKKLKESGLANVLKEEAAKGKPLLGICLGMQMLFEKSFEYGTHEGLGLIKGEIRPIEESIEKGLKIPQIGWNYLKFCKESKLFKYIKEGDFVYFVHSYHGVGCDGYTSAVTEYGGTLTASVEYKNVYGCQFHPEKSGNVGLAILKAFSEI